MKLRKYAFTPSQWSSASNKIQVTNEEGETTWDASKVVAVVELGNLVTTPAVYDEEGNETTPATYSDKYSVDILWKDEPLTTSFSTYEVWCEPMGVHAMGGQKVREEWVEVCKSKKPELFPAPEMEP
jgi:hypothetical protein